MSVCHCADKRCGCRDSRYRDRRRNYGAMRGQRRHSAAPCRSYGLVRPKEPEIDTILTTVRSTVANDYL